MKRLTDHIIKIFVPIAPDTLTLMPRGFAKTYFASMICVFAI